jgi:phospholipid transport system substrate-binding protein
VQLQRKFLKGWFFLCLVFPGAAVVSEQEGQSPRELIMQRSEALITALQVSGKTLQQRPALAYRLTEDLLAPLIEFSDLAPRVLGRHWRTASPLQRDRFSLAFRGFVLCLLARTMMAYTDEILSYSESVAYPPIHWTPAERRASVPMSFSLAGGARAEVRYLMHRPAEDWKIHDVLVFGVSLVAAYRASFAEEIACYGLDALIERLAAADPRESCIAPPAECRGR